MYPHQAMIAALFILGCALFQVFLAFFMKLEPRYQGRTQAEHNEDQEKDEIASRKNRARF